MFILAGSPFVCVIIMQQVDMVFSTCQIDNYLSTAERGFIDYFSCVQSSPVKSTEFN